MTEFIIRYTIDGEVKIEAEDAEHAAEMFAAMDIEELALTGDLISDEPKTEEQIKAEIAEIAETYPERAPVDPDWHAYVREPR